LETKVSMIWVLSLPKFVHPPYPLVLSKKPVQYTHLWNLLSPRKPNNIPNLRTPFNALIQFQFHRDRQNTLRRPGIPIRLGDPHMINLRVSLIMDEVWRDVRLEMTLLWNLYLDSWRDGLG
jgi:hypothetical protein